MYTTVRSFSAYIVVMQGSVEAPQYSDEEETVDPEKEVTKDFDGSPENNGSKQVEANVPRLSREKKRRKGPFLIRAFEPVQTTTIEAGSAVDASSAKVSMAGCDAAPRSAVVAITRLPIICICHPWID